MQKKENRPLPTTKKRKEKITKNTNENKADGYLYLNGKKYGTAADVKAELLGNIAEGDAKTFEAVNLAINELAETIGDDTKGLVKEVSFTSKILKF